MESSREGRRSTDVVVGSAGAAGFFAAEALFLGFSSEESSELSESSSVDSLLAFCSGVDGLFLAVEAVLLLLELLFGLVEVFVLLAFAVAVAAAAGKQAHDSMRKAIRWSDSFLQTWKIINFTKTSNLSAKPGIPVQIYRSNIDGGMPLSNQQS